ncbi:hypothetical protein AAOGI_34550 [Agarivorans albus]
MTVYKDPSNDNEFEQAIESFNNNVHVNQKDWLSVVKDFNRHFISAAGSTKLLQQHASQTGRRWCATHSKLQLCNT